MMIAGGIDLGGTKIEAQVFDEDWTRQDVRRIDTPKTYPDLLEALHQQVEWLTSFNSNLPIRLAFETWFRDACARFALDIWLGFGCQVQNSFFT